MNKVNCRLQALSVAMGTVLLLVRLHSAPARVMRNISAPHAWVAQVGPDVAIATLAAALLWLVALWVAVGLLAAVAGTVPGQLFSVAEQLATRMIPAALRAVVVTAAGATVLVAPLPALAQGTTASPAAPAWPVASSAAAPAWPLEQPATPAPSQPDASTSPAPSAPTRMPSSHPVATTPSVPPPTEPPKPTSHTKPTSHRTPASHPKPGSRRQPSNAPGKGTATTPSGGDTVTVQPGDSLWLIAAHRLGPRASDAEIAVEWPYWYSANRSVIGADPGLLQPGTTLAVPDDRGGAR